MSENDRLKTKSSEELYRLLPEVYRTRDTLDDGKPGDLGRYLDACGGLLDLVRATLDQRLADSFPDNPANGPACQPWLIPYFAQLVDVRLVSPDERGRREEVANAVAWRQAKGTLAVVEQIAEAVGQMEAEVQEGWRRTATTPRIDRRQLPASALGEDPLFDAFTEHPLWAARHPDLITATPDLRHPSRAMQLLPPAGSAPSNPAARQTRFSGQPTWWRQVNLHGAPCFPGSYEDVSPRTADLRTPDWHQGLFHPRRVILHVPPASGFFTPDRTILSGDLEISADNQLLENAVIDGTLRISAGSLTLRNCAVRAVEATAPAGSLAVPILAAENSLFGSITAAGLVRFEYCTLLGSLACDRIQASDSIFAGTLSLKPAPADKAHCIRFSRVPAGLAVPHLLRYRNSSASPLFFNETFGSPGCAVLHPATLSSIRFGAEDGGEMGACHQWHHALLSVAVLDKLKEFLPVGMEAVIVPDPRLCQLPFPPCQS